MHNATELMVQYAAYHRDRRNIATHFVGIPMIVFGVFVLLARLTLFEFGGLGVSAGWAVWVPGTLWYLTRGSLVLGVATSIANALLLMLAQTVAGGSTASWLAWGVGSFFVGWVIQFIGHYYEGRKPAFADDLIGLMVGPMFVTGEALFALGWGKGMLAEIERRTGPTVIRDMKTAAAK